MIGVLEVALFFFGGASGFLAGLLGIGGAIVLVPALMYILPLFGLTLSMHEITGLSLTLVFFAALTGAITHYKGGNLRKELIIIVGGPLLIGSFFGSIASKYFSEDFLVGVFALALGLSIIMLIKPKKETEVATQDGNDSKEEERAYMTNSKEKITGIALGGFSGILSGMAGIGGAAILISAMSRFLNVPIKICIGTSLGIILAGGTAGFAGKAITGQVPFIPAIFLVTGAILATRLGSKVSMKLNSEQLKKILAIVLLITFIRIVSSLIF